MASNYLQASTLLQMLLAVLQRQQEGQAREEFFQDRFHQPAKTRPKLTGLQRFSNDKLTSYQQLALNEVHN
ncbi:hypothetical protein ACFX2J_044039 [Malus domestica]